MHIYIQKLKKKSFRNDKSQQLKDFHVILFLACSNLISPALQSVHRTIERVFQENLYIYLHQHFLDLLNSLYLFHFSTSLSD